MPDLNPWKPDPRDGRVPIGPGDITPIYWLIEKYLQDDTAKQKQAMAALTKALPDILALFKSAQGAA